MTATLAGLAPGEVRRRMAAEGLALRMQPITVRVRSPIRAFAAQIHALYRDYEVLDPRDYADVDVRMLPVPGVRRFARPQVQFVVDGVTPFEGFPLDHALPMFEWGLNWVFVHRMHEYLVLHSSVVERDGRAVLLPAWPGSGKSTLAASLAVRGWRYLSDEFGVIATDSARVVPFVRPAALKNASIGVMRAFAPDSFIGPLFPGTRKGEVAHFSTPAENVRRGGESVDVAAIVFPDFQAGEAATAEPLASSATFLKLAGNAFNYETVGARAFAAVTAIVRRATSHILRYGDLDDAHRALDAIIAQGREPRA